MIVAFMALRVLFNRMIPSFIKFRAPRVDGMLPAMQTKLVALIYRTHTNAQSFPILGPCCKKGNTPVIPTRSYLDQINESSAQAL